jgi:hypothetical protein
MRDKLHIKKKSLTDGMIDVTKSVLIVGEDGVARYGVAHLCKRNLNTILVLFNAYDKDGNLLLLPEYVDSNIVSEGITAYNSKLKAIDFQRITAEQVLV